MKGYPLMQISNYYNNFGFRFKVDISQFPQISRIYENLMKLEAFKSAAPNAQPDFPLEQA